VQDASQLVFWSSLNEMRVSFFTCAPSRASDQTLKPYPNDCGGVCTASRSAARYSGVARDVRPGGWPRSSPAKPRSQECLRMRSTVPTLHPKSLAIEAFDRPTAVIRVMVALRNNALSEVEHRSSSSASHGLFVSFQCALLPSASSRRSPITRAHGVYPKIPTR
jgi:hypothetical protein